MPVADDPTAAGGSGRAQWTIPLELMAYGGIESQIHGFLEGEGVDSTARYAAQLVVEEVVRNLIDHAASKPSSETVRIEVLVTPDVVTVRIEDQCPPFDPRHAPEPDVQAPLEERRPGGLGLHLVRGMTDELTYERHGDTNRLTASVARA